MKKIATLDGLRGYAVLTILVAHLPVLNNEFVSKWLNGVPAILRFGYLGVDIFFALSGFLITRILIREKQQHQFSFKRFYLRRALRIFPAYYTCVLLAGIFISWDQLFPVAFYYNNYYSAFHEENPSMAHTWTLCVEEHFYLIWPMLIYFLSLKKAQVLITFVLPLLAIASGVACFFIFQKAEATELLYKSSNTRMLTLAFGSFLAFKESAVINMKRNLIVFLTLATTILYVLCIFLTPGHTTSAKTWMHILLLAPFSLLVVLLAIKLDVTCLNIKTLFTNKIISFVGKISYGLYLYHLPVYFLVKSMTGRNYIELPDAILAVTIIFTVATISYYVIERRFLKLKERFTNEA